MTVFTYDGSFEGLLTTLRAIWQLRADPVAIRPVEAAQGGLFAESLHIDADAAVASEVWQNLRRWIPPPARIRLYHAFLAEQPDSELLIYRYVRQAIAAAGRDLSENYADDVVRRTHELSRWLGRERHRMQAFVRFVEGDDGLFQAVIAPEVNVLPLLVDHFTDRYADQRWLIFDERRAYGLYYDGHRARLVYEGQDEALVPLHASPSDREEAFQQLWRTYYAHATIAARRNPRLHRRHLPLRYWKYLTEKQVRLTSPNDDAGPA